MFSATNKKMNRTHGLLAAMAPLEARHVFDAAAVAALDAFEKSFVGKNNAYALQRVTDSSVASLLSADAGATAIQMPSRPFDAFMGRMTYFNCRHVDAPQIDLAASDISKAGTHETEASQVTFIGKAKAYEKINLVDNSGKLVATTTADAKGQFQFADVDLKLGDNTFKAINDKGRFVKAATTFTVKYVPDTVTPENEAIHWNKVALDAIKSAKTAPPLASRALAMESIAMFDAVNAINGTSGFMLNGVAMKGASADAAIAAAAHDVLASLFAKADAAVLAKIDAEYVKSLALIADGKSENDGVALGKGMAAKIIAARSTDGSDVKVTYTPSGKLGAWNPTDPAVPNPLLPQYANVTPFAMQASNQFLPVAPPDVKSAAYAKDLNETKALGAINSATRTADQTQIAKFWAAGAGTETPPGMWNIIADNAAQKAGMSLTETTRMLATLNVAEADAAIVAWNAKYNYDTCRPVEAIQKGDGFGNSAIVADPNWQPLLKTPPFPEYTSGHSTFSRAAATVLSSFFGANYSFDATTLVGTDTVTRSFTSFDQAANEAGRSRIYGGIHFEYANVAGQDSGQKLGNYVLQYMAKKGVKVPA